MSDDRNLKIVSNPESKTKFIHSDKMYKISGSAIIAVRDYLNFLDCGVDSANFEMKMKYLILLAGLAGNFVEANFEEVEPDAEKGCQSGAE